MTKKEMRHTYRLCFRCSEESGGRYHCAKCAERRNKGRRKKKATPKSKAARCVARNAERWARVAAGLCRTCKKPSVRFADCFTCRQQAQVRLKSRTAARKQQKEAV